MPALTSCISGHLLARVVQLGWNEFEKWPVEEGGTGLGPRLPL